MEMFSKRGDFKSLFNSVTIYYFVTFVVSLIAVKPISSKRLRTSNTMNGLNAAHFI